MKRYSSEYICQKCYKSFDDLKKIGKLKFVDGYYQCENCHSDLEYESVVLRSCLLKDARKKAIENNDYFTLPSQTQIALFQGIEKTKYPNTNKYLPKWYQKELKSKSQII